MTVHGFASLITVSNAERYISRRARSSTMESLMRRYFSWLLHAKCFTEVPIPMLCTPRTHAAPILPAKRGSSDTYSKFLPQRGDLLILIAGPRTIDTSWSMASSPMARPIASISSSLKELAVVAAGGKQVASRLSPLPLLPSSESCLRRPCGPSVIMMYGTLLIGSLCVLQKSHPEQSDAFCFTVSFFIREDTNSEAIVFSPLLL